MKSPPWVYLDVHNKNILAFIPGYGKMRKIFFAGRRRGKYILFRHASAWRKTQRTHKAPKYGA